MIHRLFVCRARGTDPYENLALEEALLHRVGEGELILYLWQNERTVVIGKNQNPWKECRTALLEEEGGHLARRLSGGGAVFHDLGNLNFTFLMSEGDYDLPRQLTVLERACQGLGIPAQRSGRNDLLADGRKFSGNAFYSHAGKAYHHGTLMVDVNMEHVQRYLSPSKAKLAAKGVDSVRSRVVNLREFVPTLSIDTLAQALTTACSELYDVPAEVMEAETPELPELKKRYGSEAWLYGQKLPFTVSCEDRFSWGGVELQLQVNEGVIQAVKLYTDAMDDRLPPRVEAALQGVSLQKNPLEQALREACPEQAQREDFLRLLFSIL